MQLLMPICRQKKSSCSVGILFDLVPLLDWKGVGFVVHDDLSMKFLDANCAVFSWLFEPPSEKHEAWFVFKLQASSSL